MSALFRSRWLVLLAECDGARDGGELEATRVRGESGFGLRHLIFVTVPPAYLVDVSVDDPVDLRTELVPNPSIGNGNPYDIHRFSLSNCRTELVHHQLYTIK